MMEEVFPVLAGVAVGLVAQLVDSKRFRVLLIGVFAVVLGAFASWFSGELLVSWFYVVIDTAQVLGASVMTLVLVRAWRRQAQRVTR